MTHATPSSPVTRAWLALAPKLIAFLATGLTSSALISIAQLLGIPVSPSLAVIIVGGLSSVAAVIIRDNLLTLGIGQLSLKVVVFIVSSASATTVVALLGQFGIDLSPYSGLIGAGLTLIATLLGYLKSDTIAPLRRSNIIPSVPASDGS